MLRNDTFTVAKLEVEAFDLREVSGHPRGQLPKFHVDICGCGALNSQFLPSYTRWLGGPQLWYKF